jgi:regulator of cell morphogenesis and NO signaling
MRVLQKQKFFMTNVLNKTLAEIVREDNHAAAVLEKFKLDYCCKGKRTLEHACSENNIPVSTVLDELENMQEQFGSKDIMPFTEMNAEQLIAHILTHHHFYVKQSVPQIIAHLEKLVQKHGHHFEWINEGYETFIQLAEELLQHMRKEEMVLFPLIKEIENYYNEESSNCGFMNITAPISVMEHEHQTAGRLMERLRSITNDYTPEETACTTHRVTLAELKEFEENLHQHVHLENNILFPLAINMYHELEQD